MRIECPECSQRFTVEASLDGKMVECGACDKRFRVSERVMVNKPKMEFKQSMRKDHAAGEEPIHASTAGSLTPSKPAPQVDYREPSKPVQTLAGIAALFLTAVLWLVFIYGSRVGGALKDVDLTKRYVLAGAFAVVILFLFILSSKRNRLLAFGLGLLFGGSLLIAPTLFPVHTTPTTTTDLDSETLILEDSGPIEVEVPLEAERPLADRVGSKPLEAAWSESGRSRVIGVMVSGVEDGLLPQLRVYLERKLRSSKLPGQFDRESGCLMVVAPTTVGFEEAQQILKEIGEITETDTNKRLIALSVATRLFDLPPPGVLSSPSSPDFYRLNAEELRAFDHERVIKAAERLKAVAPIKMRGDVRGRLIEKINSATDAPKEFYSTLPEALVIWANEEDPEAVAAVEYAVQKSETMKMPISRNLLVFLLQRNSVIGRNLLKQRWSQDPSNWEVLYLQVPRKGNEAAFKDLVAALTDGTISEKRSAAALLGTVGGPEALKSLEKIAKSEEASDDIEFGVQLKNSIEAIKRRLDGATVPEAGAAGEDAGAPPLPDLE